MIPAYHFIPPEFIKDVLREGVIRPGNERVDPSRFEGYCGDEINELLRDMREQEKKVNPIALEVLQNLVDSEINSLCDWQRELKGGPGPGQTQFKCWDLLAKDIDLVFLQAWDWPTFTRVSTGLIFDAEELVRKGAAVRTYDLVATYDAMIQDVLTGKWDDHGDVYQAFEDGFERVFKGYQFTGEEALRLLRRKPTEYDEAQELVWGGALDVALAVEIVKPGKARKTDKARRT
jgi:hypothetical protein